MLGFILRRCGSLVERVLAQAVDDRIRNLNQEIGRLDRRVEYLGSRLNEWIDCGHHSTEYHLHGR